MKISKWEELDGIESGKYQVSKYYDSIGIREITEDTDCVDICFTATSKEKTLAILKVFGFDIEFEEAPKLSKREWHLVNFLEECWWIARDESKYLYAHEIRPSKSNGEWGSLARHDFIELPDVLFPFITPDRAWSVKELRELEVEE